MNPQTQTIAQGIRTILTEGGDGNFVIFYADREAATYVQIAAGKGSTRLWIEAATHDAIRPDQHATLQELGWTDPRKGGLYNYFREYKNFDLESDLPDLAQWIADTLRRVYHLPEDGAVVAEVELQ